MLLVNINNKDHLDTHPTHTATCHWHQSSHQSDSHLANRLRTKDSPDRVADRWLPCNPVVQEETHLHHHSCPLQLKETELLGQIQRTFFKAVCLSPSEQHWRCFKFTFAGGFETPPLSASETTLAESSPSTLPEYLSPSNAFDVFELILSLLIAILSFVADIPASASIWSVFFVLLSVCH